MPDPSPRPKIGVKAVIVRDDRLLTVVKRYEEDIVHILPGGSQEQGETLDAALRRECEEEIGATVSVERLLFVREYIGANHEHATSDRDLHIVDIVFACQLPDDYQPHVGPLPDPDQVGVAWLPLDALAQHQLYPAALKEWLLKPVSAGVYVGDIN